MMRMVLLVTVAAALLAPSLASAQAETVHSTEQTEFEVLAFSECTSEAIEVQGIFLLAGQVTFDSSGGTHIHTTFALHNVSGTTAAGERVRFISTSVFQFNETISGAFPSLSNENLLLVVQGANNDSFLNITVHSTITPDGRLTGRVGQVTQGCR
jgi:hypothetical protein